MDINGLRDRYSNEGIRSRLNSFTDDESRVNNEREKEKKRRELEEQRKRELEERRREQAIEARRKALSDIVSENNATDNVLGTPQYNDITRENEENMLYPHKQYSAGLRKDILDTVDMQKAIGTKDEDIKKSLIPPEDTNFSKRLQDISSMLKTGDEGFFYNIQEGLYEREIMNMLSKEYVRKMNGQSNHVDELEQFIEDNPELMPSENQGFWKKSFRGAADLFRQGYEGYKSSLTNPATYAVIGALAGASLLVGSVTGGIGTLATMPLVAKAVASLGTAGAISWGMKYGSLEHMAELEAGSSYKEQIEEGIHPDVAKVTAQTVGAVNGLIEIMQIDTALSAIPGLSELVENGSKKATKEAAKEITKVLANYGVDLASNVIEEMLQEGVSIGGLELSKYLEGTPNPNTLDGLKALSKTFTEDAYRERVLDTGLDALQSMWLAPIISSGTRIAGQKALGGMVNTVEQAQYEKRLGEAKKIWLSDEENITDILIKDIDNTKNPDSINMLNAGRQVLNEVMTRADTSNQDIDKISKQVEKINNTLSNIMYEAKENNPDIEYRPTSPNEISEMVLSEDFFNDNEVYTPINEYNVDMYREAKKYNVADTIRDELKKGTPKSKIIEAITKSLPKEYKKQLDVMSMINSVELVNDEIEAQITMNNLYNLEQAKEEISENKNLQTNIEDTPSRSDIAPSFDEDNTQPSTITSTEDNNTPMEVSEGENKTDEDLEENEGISEEATVEYKPSDVVMVPVEKIHVDPERFQFRYDKGNEGGATSKLVGAEWNDKLAGTVLLWQDEYGDLYAVNGHHRVDLAIQNNVAELKSEIITYKEATAEEARSIGAMINIAEDNATSIDVAKLMRDTNITIDEMQKFGVRPNSKIAKDGLALSKLNDWIFTQVATKGIPIERAVIIGNELGDNKEGQNQIIRALDKLESKGKNITNDVLTELLAEVKGTAQDSFTEQTLFGEETFTKNYSVERAEVVSYVKGQLKNRVNLLKNVSKEKNAKILNELGNTIKVDENVKDMTDAEQALWIIDKTLNYQGTKTNEMFNNLAKEYANAQPSDKMAVKKKALNELINLIEGGDLLNETLNRKAERERAKNYLNEIRTNGEGRQESGIDLQTTREETIQNQVDLFGEDTVNQLKEIPNVKIEAKETVKSKNVYKDTSKIAEAMQHNVFLNGLTIEYTDIDTKKYWTRGELDERGYQHFQEGYYESAGQYIPESKERGRIILNNEGDRTTIIEEAIHHIQTRAEQISPRFAVALKAWEDEINRKAIEQGIKIPQGKELFAQAYVFGELGYADKGSLVAEFVAIDDDLVKTVDTILGDEILELSRGEVESPIAKKGRILRSEYKSTAQRMFMEKGYATDFMQAVEKRRSEIKNDLTSDKAVKYYNPSSGQYVIVHPSTKGSKYQMTYFDPKYGALMDRQYLESQLDALSKDIVDEGFYYKYDEIAYQLKSYNRSVADELYEIAISRGYRTDNSTGTNGGRISFEVTDNQIIDAYHDAKVGNFNAHDFDELILNNKEVTDSTKNDISKGIMEAVDKGYDVPNSEVKLNQFLNRFYNIDQYSLKTPENMSPRAFTVRFNPETNKTEIGFMDYSNQGEMRFDAYKSFDKLEDAIESYKENLPYFKPDSDEKLKASLAELVPEKFSYTVEMLSASKGITKTQAEKRIVTDLFNQYKEFRDNIETYRHKGLNYNFDMKPHYNISYQLKKVTDVNSQEFKDWFKDSKVVDENGEPLIVYHGTDIKFDKFKEGFNFFSDEEQFADNYSGTNGKILKCYLSIKNLFDPFNKDHFNIFANSIGDVTADLDLVYENAYYDLENYDSLYEDYLDQMPREIFKEMYGDILKYDKYDKFINDERLHDQTWTIFENHMDEIKSLGFDGLKITEDGAENYVAFYPSQIKPIEDGMVYEYNPNINYQLKKAKEGIKQYSLDSEIKSFNNFISNGETIQVEYTKEFLPNGIKVLTVNKVLDEQIYDFVAKDAVLGGYNFIKVADTETQFTEEEKQEKNIDVVKEILGQDEYLYYGLRKDDYEFQLGDSTFNSHELFPDPEYYPQSDELVYPYIEKGIYAGFYDAGELDGTSSIEIESTDNIGNKINYMKKYQAKNLYLIAGDNAGYGNDAGELIIRNAVVLAKLYMDKNNNISYSIPVTPQMIEDVMTEGQPLFQLKEVNKDDDLLAMHNISEGNLKSAIKLGGFPMPSIAIIKKDQPFTDYGKISLIFDKDTIDPTNHKNKIYSGDAWTPMFPMIDSKINSKVLIEINNRIDKLLGVDMRKTFQTNLDESNAADKINRSNGDFAEAYKDNTALKMAYLNDIGKMPKPVIVDKRYSNDVSNNVLKYINEVFDNKAADMFNSGKVMEYEETVRNTINNYAKEHDGDGYQETIKRVEQPDGKTEYEHVLEPWEKLTFNKLNNILMSADRYALSGKTKEIDKYATGEKIERIFTDDINVGFEKWLNKLGEGIIEKQGIRNDKELYTPSGNRRGFNQLHWDYNLENIVKAMEKENPKGNAGVFMSPGAMMGASTKEYSSIGEMKKDTNRLNPNANEIKGEKKAGFEQRINEMVEYMAKGNKRSDNSFIAYNDAMEAIAEAISKKTKTAMKNSLEQWAGFFNVNDELVNNIAKLKKDFADMDVSYFEAKPQRAVALNEIQAVIAPTDLDPQLEQKLKDNGIHLIEKYDNNVDGSKQQAIDNVLRTKDISFQLKKAENKEIWDTSNANKYYQLKEESEPEMKERSWGQTVKDASITEKWLNELLTSNKFMYEVKHNEDTIISAAKLIQDKGEAYVEARILSDIPNDTVLFASSQILTYKFMEDGEQERAMAMIEKTAEKATSMGQAIQILSVWGRQTPEGMLRSVSKLYRDAMTDADRQKVVDKTNELKKAFNELNRQAIENIDLVGSVEKLKNISADELLNRKLATTDEGKELVNKYGIESIVNKEGLSNEDLQKLESFLDKTPIDDTMSDKIIKVIKDHYIEGKGNLKEKLVNTGLNDFEAEILSMYVKQQMKQYAKDEKMSLLNDLPRQEYERKGIDQKLLDDIAEGKVDENLLKSYVGEKEGLPVLSKDLVDYIYNQGQYINSLEPGREKDIATGKLMQEVADNIPASKWAKLRTIQTMAQLLNFKTTLRNLIGNDMFRRLDTFTLNFLGTPIDKLLAMNTKKRSMLFRYGESKKLQKQGYKQGWKLGLEDALLGIDTFDQDSKFELKRTRTFDSGILGQAEKALNITMRATDRAAYTATFLDALEEQMQLEGVDTPTEEMTERAAMLGLYRTFNDKTTLSEMFSGIKRALNKPGSNITGGEFGLGELIMKYPKTPANMLGRAIDYSPMGMVVTMAKLYGKSDPYIKQRLVTEGMSRALMGTGLIAIGAVLAKMGVLTGSNPDDDKDIYKLEKAYGLRDFSVNVSSIPRYILSGFKDPSAGELKQGDVIASYDWNEPISMPLAIGADAILGSGDTLDLLSTIMRTLETGVTTLTDQPLLSGLSTLFKGGKISQGFGEIIKGVGSSFTPSLLAHTAQFIDGRDTDPYTFYGWGRQAYNMVANRVPGLRNTLPGRYTILGDEKRYYPEDMNVIAKTVNAFLNPAITSKYMPPKEAEFIFDLYSATGDADIVPRPPQKSYKIDGETYTFTPETWASMSEWLGKEYRKRIGYAMSGYMRGWSKEEQAEEIKFIIKEVKDEAKEKAKQLGNK